MKMKSLKAQFIGAIAMVLVAAIAMGSSTYAWFAMNTEVKAQNMRVTATAEGSLVITKDALPTATTDSNFVKVDADNAEYTALLASTHDHSATDNKANWTTYPEGLYTISNANDVSANTGLELTGKTLTPTRAQNPATGTPYYVDKVVYIASAGSVLTNQNITITIDNVSTAIELKTGDNEAKELPKATSIDFYYKVAGNTIGAPTPSDSTFVGTLNIAQKDPVTNDASTALTQIQIPGINIPKAGTDAITVLMRIYVDGNLKDSATTTYIKTKDAADIRNVGLDVKFVAASAS